MTDYEIDSLWMRRTNIHNGELMPQLRDFARAVIKEAVAKEREACARICENKSRRPCDCITCDCGNRGDAEAVARWDADEANAQAIRARGAA